MGRMCNVHTNQPSVTMCHQCHKAICKSCTMVTPHGTFCSSECSVIFREFKEKMKGSAPKSSGGAAKGLLSLIVLVVLIVVGIHVGARYGNIQALKGYDILGKFLPETPVK